MGLLEHQAGSWVLTGRPTAGCFPHIPMGLFKPQGLQVQNFPVHECFLFQPWVLAATEGKLQTFLVQLGLLRVSHRLNVDLPHPFLGMGHLLPLPLPFSPQFLPLSEVISTYSKPAFKQCKPGFRKSTWWFHIKFFWLWEQGL